MLCTFDEQQFCRTFTVILMCNCLFQKNSKNFFSVQTNFGTLIGIKKLYEFRKTKQRERKMYVCFILFFEIWNVSKNLKVNFKSDNYNSSIDAASKIGW